MRRANPILKPLTSLGAGLGRGVGLFGQFWRFAAAAIGYAPLELGSRRGWRRILPQAFSIGTRSVPVIMATGMFVGMVLVVQGWDQFQNANLTDRLGGIVNISVAAELGPVLAGVMLAGRVGGALTAELGTMNVTEQLLALRSMGADPIRYLVAPRFIACLLLAPVLTLYANLMGAIGSWAVYTGVFGGDSEPFWSFTKDALEMWDLGAGLTKAVFFGGFIGLISCYKGFHCRAGAEGVGRACTEAFVSSFIVILALDFFLNFMLNGMYKNFYGMRVLI